MGVEAAALDAQVRRAVAWHFDPATGSRYWLARAAEWGFDPRTEIGGMADLLRLPALADDLRRVPARDLIPRGCWSGVGEMPFMVWESGGTTGTPRRVVDAGDRAAALQRMEPLLAAHGFPSGQLDDWLHVGPSGPHLVGRTIQRLANRRGALLHYIDMDPRWVRRLIASGQHEQANAYTRHLVDQAVLLLHAQPIAVLAVTPPLLTALCLQPLALQSMRERLTGVIWFGTSASAETVRQWQECLPGVPLVGWYGNTLTGISVQRPPQPGDPHPAVFIPPWPDAYVVPVDPADPTQEVAPGEGGAVRISVLAREMFLPHHVERDWAVRVAAPPGEPDGLAGVRPLVSTGTAAVVEGVY